MLLPVQGGNGGGRLFVTGHFDKSKAFAAAGVAVIDDLGAGDLAMLAKQLFEV
jgi:hypothetical protein